MCGERVGFVSEIGLNKGFVLGQVVSSGFETGVVLRCYG